MRYVINAYGYYVEWYKDAKFHRLYGPFWEHASGSKNWYINGKCHREDGPAREYPNGRKNWYIDGKYIKTEFKCKNEI